MSGGGCWRKPACSGVDPLPDADVFVSLNCDAAARVPANQLAMEEIVVDKGLEQELIGLEKKWLLDVSNGFEEISEWGSEQVDDGDVGCGVSVSSGTGP